MKNKLKVLSVLSAALLLSGCDGLVDNSGSTPSIVVPPSTSISGDSTSGNSTIPGPNVETVKMKTSDSKEIPGAAVTVASGDEEIIGIEQQSTKAIIYALSAGKVTLTNGTDTFEIIVSYDAHAIGSGSDYMYATDPKKIEEFRSETLTQYQVGTKNAFKPDVVLQYDTLKRNTDGTYVPETMDIEITEAHKHFMNNEQLNYTFTLANDGSSAENLVTVNDDATISFKDAAIGKSIKLTIDASFSNKKVTQTYFINEGYNAYSHKDFKELFQNNKISCINLLHNINAEYDESQMYFNTKYKKNVPFNTQDDEKEIKWQGSMYFRYGGSKYGELQSLVINGNYMTINATNLPEHVAILDADSEGGFFDANDKRLDGLAGTQAGFIDKGQASPTVVNPQEAIFRLQNFDKTGADKPNFTIKNLELIGDSKKGDSENSTKHSGGSVGVILGDGMNGLLENVYFRNLVYGAQANHNTTELKLKDSTIEETWGSSVTTWEAKKLLIENSALKKAGAPTIWNIQSYGASSGNGSVLCEVKVDKKSEITNYLTPDSEWFTAYGLTTIKSKASAIETIMQKIKYTIYKPGTSDEICFALLLQHPSDTSRNARTNLTIGGQSADLNPAQFLDTKNNPIGAGIFAAAENSILLALGQVIDSSIYDTDATKLQNNYMAQLATKLKTYKLSGEQHLFIEVAVNFTGFGLLSAVLEVTPVSTSN